MLTQEQLTGVYVPIVTPFDSSGAVDLTSFERHVRWLADRGIHGLVVNGTTGESPTVAWEEVEALVKTAKNAVGGKLPVIVGTGTNDTASTVKRTELAGRLGADAVLVVVPYYNRPSQEGIATHFRKAAEVGIPVIAYDNPSRTGVGLTAQTAEAVLELDGVIGLKDSSGGIQLLTELSRLSSKPVLCGDDSYAYAMLCCGAKGGILTASNVVPEALVEMHRQFAEGDSNGAKQTFEGLLPLIRLLFKESNPAPVKWILAHRGIISSEALRLPMTSISAKLGQELEAYWNQAGELVK
ncbi:4-hydroxy-tetrahydrodipicolinate synthase [Paenibacillus elgii]|uniref:4-hydroxy-tetrahydrodipicolinate synthase n=1 Tax=Paenibacillus elgii TaxID=189691 RepID=A0A163VSU6_9BACL|nr:4-hydroxy-tetrahydrodipicolinate synthase [Paenibacillus elgii]KZE75341.1 4-hydroxy-tetrahydrodipicolinate synthase [Paenibacillus elgii]MCM3270579.1 4-hydroxy-tetrahydrodipicolinate synthase [Paenibacillus elgii]NEN87340.1 4-hydroxy-tetrahydrodipicolinate synthase [Paenibacillus elgii]